MVQPRVPARLPGRRARALRRHPGRGDGARLTWLAPPSPACLHCGHIRDLALRSARSLQLSPGHVVSVTRELPFCNACPAWHGHPGSLLVLPMNPKLTGALHAQGCGKTVEILALILSNPAPPEVLAGVKSADGYIQSRCSPSAPPPAAEGLLEGSLPLQGTAAASRRRCSLRAAESASACPCTDNSGRFLAQTTRAFSSTSGCPACTAPDARTALWCARCSLVGPILDLP